MSPASDSQIHRPNSVDQRGPPPHERGRPKKLVQPLRIGTLNVGSMTGRGRVLADSMKTRKVDVLCVQETRWKGNKAKELGEGQGTDEEKEQSWAALQELEKIDKTERCIIGGDMNGHVGSGTDAISRLHGNAYGNGDEDGEKCGLLVYDFTTAVSQKQKRKGTTQRRIKWLKLKENDFQQEFNES
ncbi:uncharacterized protein LOC119568274 [Penaeus monodon]|uniref:uncharacterized protein LOC119568274 n=1 Tax=Penaeus monodon TaxID=6687 RepID=UPI0018A72FBE|nr:uncharacterized protein LOC119568274 [Penaeus monodon]